MSFAEVTDAIATSAAVLTVGFVGFQLFQDRRKAYADRAAEIAGVAVAWRAIEKPYGSPRSSDDRWVFEVEVNNPGKLPITDVRVILDLTVPSRRVHHEGSTEDEQGTLNLLVPVIIGGRSRTWKRTVLINSSARGNVGGASASVEFLDASGNKHQNRYPA